VCGKNSAVMLGGAKYVVAAIPQLCRKARFFNYGFKMAQSCSAA